MNLKKLLGRERRWIEAELNIVPVMNLFLVIIPFLLLTAVFVRIAILELSLPSMSKKGAWGETPSNIVLIILAINNDGFQVKTTGTRYPPISKIGQNYDYQELINQLRMLKANNPTAEDIIIQPQSEIKYDIIIKVMDRCRENGFPNISLSG